MAATNRHFYENQKGKLKGTRLLYQCQDPGKKRTRPDRGQEAHSSVPQGIYRDACQRRIECSKGGDKEPEKTSSKCERPRE